MSTKEASNGALEKAMGELAAMGRGEVPKTSIRAVALKHEVTYDLLWRTVHRDLPGVVAILANRRSPATQAALAEWIDIYEGRRPADFLSAVAARHGLSRERLRQVVEGAGYPTRLPREKRQKFLDERVLGRYADLVEKWRDVVEGRAPTSTFAAFCRHHGMNTVVLRGVVSRAGLPTSGKTEGMLRMEQAIKAWKKTLKTKPPATNLHAIADQYGVDYMALRSKVADLGLPITFKPWHRRSGDVVASGLKWKSMLEGKAPGMSFSAFVKEQDVEPKTFRKRLVSIGLPTTLAAA